MTKKNKKNKDCSFLVFFCQTSMENFQFFPKEFPNFFRIEKQIRNLPNFPASSIVFLSTFIFFSNFRHFFSNL